MSFEPIHAAVAYATPAQPAWSSIPTRQYAQTQQPLIDRFEPQHQSAQSPPSAPKFGWATWTHTAIITSLGDVMSRNWLSGFIQRNLHQINEASDILDRPQSRSGYQPHLLFADSYVHNGAQFNEERPRTRLWEAHEIDAFMSKMAQDPNVTQRMTQEIRKATRPGSTNENGINATLREYDHLVTTLQQVRHKPLSALTNEQHTDLVNTIARLSHFVTDMCNPFHNSFTNWMLYQSDYGAHMRFESEFSLRNAKEKEQFQIWETQFKKAYHTVKSNTKEGHVEDRTPLNKFFEWAFPQREAMGLAQAPELARKLKHEHKLANPDSPDPQFNERSDLREFLIQRTVWGANKVRDMYYEEQALRAHYANAPDEYQKALEAKWKPIAEKSIVDSGIVLKNILELAWNQARTSEQHPKGSVQPSMPIRLPGLQGERTYFSVPTA